MHEPGAPTLAYRRAVARRRRERLAHLGIALMILVLAGAVAVARYAEQPAPPPAAKDGSAWPRGPL